MSDTGTTGRRRGTPCRRRCGCTAFQLRVAPFRRRQRRHRNCARMRAGPIAPQGVAGRQLRVAVASGIGNAQRLVEKMRAGEAQYDFVEVSKKDGKGGRVDGRASPIVLLC